MAYDDTLAQRFREGLRGRRGVSEKRMMGGLCLMVDGNMLGGVDKTKSGDDKFMFRVGKANEAAALRLPGASIVTMGGKRLGGLIFVEAEACDDRALQRWITLALGFVTSLPTK